MRKINDMCGKAAFLATNGFCEREYVQAQNALVNLGIDCRLVSLDYSVISGWNEVEAQQKSNWGYHYAPDSILSKACPSEYTVLVIPGGIRNILKLQLDKNTRSFISFFIQAKKPIIAYNKGADLLPAFSDKSSNVLLLNDFDETMSDSLKTFMLGFTEESKVA